jgi:hypothetical protein
MTVVQFPEEKEDSFRHAQNGAVVYEPITDIRRGISVLTVKSSSRNRGSLF